MDVRLLNVIRLCVGAACLAVVGVVGLLHIATYCGVSPLDDLPWVEHLAVAAGAFLAVGIALLVTGPDPAGEPGTGRWAAAVFVGGFVYFLALVLAQNVLTDDYWYDGRTGRATALEDGTFALVYDKPPRDIVARIDMADYRWLRRLRFLVMSSFSLPFLGTVAALLLGSRTPPRDGPAEPTAAPDHGGM